MAQKQHLSILKQGALPWNEWRTKNPAVQPDLREASLTGTSLRGINLSRANLEGAELASIDLQEANLLGSTVVEANLRDANLQRADLSFADLTFASLTNTNLTAARLWKADLTAAQMSGADLSAANLTMAMLRETDLTGANLSGAMLDYAILLETNLQQANLTGCSVCGVSAWNIDLAGAREANLAITLPSEPTIMVDTLEVAQFISLLLNHRQIHEVITGMTSNIVLILGRFTPERKPILETLRDGLRERGYTPMLLDFEKPLSRDFSQSLRTLAHMARFVIADLSLHKSIAQQLRALLPDIRVPVQPLLNGSRRLSSLFPELKQYSCVLPAYRYRGLADLQATLEEKIIQPAEEKAHALTASSSAVPPHIK